jgi:hypothetical protein
MQNYETAQYFFPNLHLLVNDCQNRKTVTPFSKRTQTANISRENIYRYVTRKKALLQYVFNLQLSSNGIINRDDNCSIYSFQF